ncbi:MAG: O-antigen ligase family protein [bacterium]
MNLLTISKVRANSILLPIMLGGSIAVGVMLLSIHLDNEFILLGLPLLCLIIILLIIFPEISFGLFLTAGVYKADPRLEFLPIFLDLTVLFGFLSMVGVLYGILISRKIKLILPQRSILWPYIIIIFLSFFSLTYTLASIYGTDKLLRLSTITLLSCFLPFYLFQKEAPIDRFFLLFIALAFAMFLDIATGGLSPEEIGFKTAFGSNYLAVGRICGNAAIVLSLYSLMTSKSNLNKILYIVLLTTLLFALFISGGRGPLIALLLSVSCIFLYLLVRSLKSVMLNFTLKKNHLKILLIVFTVFLLVPIFLFISFYEYFETIIMRIHVLQEWGGFSALERILRFKRAFEAITSFPTAVTGLGIGGFSVYYEGFDDKRGAYPHNIFLEIGSELGLLGLLSFILMLYFSFYNGLSNIKKAQTNKMYFLSLTLLALLINMLLNSSISGDISDNRLLFAWIGIIYSTKNLIKAMKVG